jgi:hypothetical protein
MSPISPLKSTILKKVKMGKCTLLTVIIVILTANACKHLPDTGPPCVAGSGGSVTIVVYAKHGSTSIPNYYTHLDTAFVKFGTTNSPETKPVNFNTYYVGEPGEDHIHCYGLKCGDYYIYRTAWDSIENVRRYGGYGISIADTNGEKSVTVAVN